MELKEGAAEVVLKKLSKSLDKDSVRVDGIGPASVTEVSFQVHGNCVIVLPESYGQVTVIVMSSRCVGIWCYLLSMVEPLSHR